MKKITTMVNIVLSGKDGATVPFNYEASDVFDALKAHRDIEHTSLVPGDQTTMKHIVPFHGVDMAMFFRQAQTVAAPEDAFCGVEQKRLVVTYEEPLPGVTFSTVDTGCEVQVPKFTPVITFDGEALSYDDFIANGGTEVVEGATLRNGHYYLPVDCNAVSVTYTTVYTYQGETCSVTVTQGRGLG